MAIFYQSLLSFLTSGEKINVGENDGEFDFRKPKVLGEALSKLSGSGFDHTFVKCHKSSHCAR